VQPFNGNYIDTSGELRNLDGGEGSEPNEINNYMSPFYGVFIGSDGQEHGIEEVLGVGGGSSGGGGGGLPADTTTDEIPEGTNNLYYTDTRVDSRIFAANLAAKTLKIPLTLPASGWSNSVVTVPCEYISEELYGVIVLSQSVTQEQFLAWKNGDIVVSGQTEDSMTFTAFGDTPTVDISVEILIFG
jgi:hypothetical protein